jgi:hypothetical protein
MTKTVTLALVSILGMAGVSIINQPKAEAELVSSYRAEAHRMIALEKAVIEAAPTPKRQYKKNEQLSPEELKSILHSVGFRGEALKQAWGTAMKESTGRPRSHNDNPATGDNSYGLFQINMIGSLGPARLDQFDLKKNSDLFDPVRNAEIAFFMSNGGKNWSAWHGITDKTREWMKQFPN